MDEDKQTEAQKLLEASERLEKALKERQEIVEIEDKVKGKYIRLCSASEDMTSLTQYALGCWGCFFHKETKRPDYTR